jgi:hypothetical protein
VRDSIRRYLDNQKLSLGVGVRQNAAGVVVGATPLYRGKLLYDAYVDKEVEDKEHARGYLLLSTLHEGINLQWTNQLCDIYRS